MSTNDIHIDLDFDTEQGVPPWRRSYPSMNPPPGNEALPGSVWTQSHIIEENFYIDRNVEIHNQRELAYAIRTEAWRRLSDYKFTDDPSKQRDRGYHVQFVFSTQITSDWWRHIFIVRMMSEMAKVDKRCKVAFPLDNPFFRLDLVC